MASEITSRSIPLAGTRGSFSATTHSAPFLPVRLATRRPPALFPRRRSSCAPKTTLDAGGSLPLSTAPELWSSAAATSKSAASNLETAQARPVDLSAAAALLPPTPCSPGRHFQARDIANQTSGHLHNSSLPPTPCRHGRCLQAREIATQTSGSLSSCSMVLSDTLPPSPSSSSSN